VPARGASLAPLRARLALAILGVGVFGGLFWSTSEASARVIGFAAASGVDPAVTMVSSDLKRPRSLAIDIVQTGGTAWELEADYAITCIKGQKQRRKERSIPAGFASWHDRLRKPMKSPDRCYVDAVANFHAFPRSGRIVVRARGVSRPRFR
jgi:hypothetical protein